MQNPCINCFKLRKWRAQSNIAPDGKIGLKNLSRGKKRTWGIMDIIFDNYKKKGKKYIFTASKNFGIGTANPSAFLHIVKKKKRPGLRLSVKAKKDLRKKAR